MKVKYFVVRTVLNMGSDSGFPRSWKILENVAVMESHGKVLEYENFPKSHGK